MPSNFFTRAFGLHPTPQICFPPPPITPVGNKTWFWTMLGPFTPNTTVPGWILQVHDPDTPAGDPITYGVSQTGLVQHPPFTCPNDGSTSPLVDVVGTPGTYLAELLISWPDGAESHGQRNFAIL